MPVVSVIVDIENNSGEAVLHSLAVIGNVSVFGVKDNQIVAVIEGKDMKAVENTIKELYAIKNVLGAYPILACGYE
ncbi:MAG: chaperone NapD [Planctomycetota bacterium]|mgnify:FL=1|nr:chaperone NapD [Nitrospirota bacterium]